MAKRARKTYAAIPGTQIKGSVLLIPEELLKKENRPKLKRTLRNYDWIQVFFTHLTTTNVETIIRQVALIRQLALEMRMPSFRPGVCSLSRIPKESREQIDRVLGHSHINTWEGDFKSFASHKIKWQKENGFPVSPKLKVRRRLPKSPVRLVRIIRG